LNDGNIHTVKVEYKEKSLKVFIDDLNKASLNVDVDLTKIFDSFWIGFTGATGGISQSHDLLSLAFSSTLSNSFIDLAKPIVYSTGKYDLILK
jgi:hypothetical protein